MKRKKGFTFIELIIVMAIIAIFAAILIPTWSYFLSRARTRQNNAVARTVFNAAQTAVVEMNSNERSLHVDPTERYVTNPFYYYWDGRHGFSCDSAGNSLNATPTQRDVEFGNAVNRVLDTPQYAYKIFVSDNKVEAVSVGRNDEDPYVGVYPVSLQDAEDNGRINAAQHRAFRNGYAVGVTLEDFTV